MPDFLLKMKPVSKTLVSCNVKPSLGMSVIISYNQVLFFFLTVLSASVTTGSTSTSTFAPPYLDFDIFFQFCWFILLLTCQCGHYYINNYYIKWQKPIKRLCPGQLARIHTSSVINIETILNRLLLSFTIMMT